MGADNNDKKKRRGPGKTILVILLAIADIALLFVIIMGFREAKDREIREANTYLSESRGVMENEERDTKSLDVGEERTNESANIMADEEENTESVDDAEEEKNAEPVDDVEEDTDVDAVSTEERPSLSDFMWYFDGVYWNDIPEDAKYISDSDMLQGSWKLFTWYYHNEGQDTYWIEFGNVSLDFDGDNVTVAVTPYIIYPPSGGDSIDLTENGVEKYSGKWDGNGLSANGAGNFHVTDFYTLDDGKQYAIGSIDEPDGTPTVIALVRP